MTRHNRVEYSPARMARSAYRKVANRFASFVRRGGVYKINGQRWREDTRGKCTQCGLGRHSNPNQPASGERRFVQTWWEPLTERASHLGKIKRTDPICAACAIKEANV